MSCFSLGFVEQLCIFLIVLFAVMAIIKLLLPLAGGFLPPIVIQIITIVLYAVVAIAIVILIFDLLSCLIGSGGLSLSLPRR